LKLSIDKITKTCVNLAMIWDKRLHCFWYN